jgi:hypothetical protein
MKTSIEPGDRSGREAFAELGRDARNALQGILGAISLLLDTPLTGRVARVRRLRVQRRGGAGEGRTP